MKTLGCREEGLHVVTRFVTGHLREFTKGTSFPVASWRADREIDGLCARFRTGKQSAKAKPVKKVVKKFSPRSGLSGGLRPKPQRKLLETLKSG
jgi:hypothetical protein